MQTDETAFGTSDLTLAADLQLAGFRLTGQHLDSDGRWTLIFRGRATRLRQTVARYRFGVLAGSARELRDNERFVRRHLGKGAPTEATVATSANKVAAPSAEKRVRAMA